jgi:uncharacterized protein
MLGELNDGQIENLLSNQVTGRIACSNNGLPYIVPINYYYDGEKIISHSVEGKKFPPCAKNLWYAAQIDQITNTFQLAKCDCIGTF